ncbi:lysophospholipid acyltransferase family protein [Thermohalobacter berrensis]|uniref:1-acyl-sn-glycerol-3-phosphate acyltransferase n=1 Tax=Thermohalobacter berrensis TaxID=99594 RepID=A0A419TAN2_9FIRM|nr:lysophospholipid acyltransferase family protein [Thermohalobacter berrensis]RKD34521.1 acyl-phosphate glycerol 3-phosphate acyltransferase [Thermohalobacter berrensis]
MSFYKLAKNLSYLFFNFIYRIEINGLENIPKKGRLIICSNHKSLLDPILVGISLNRKVHFMAKKELFKNKFFSIILKKLGAFPVDRKNTDLSAIKKSIRILKEEKVLGIFPEGTRVNNENIKHAKPGVAMISIKSKSPVIPVYIDTDYKLFNKVKINIGNQIEFKNYYSKKNSQDDYKKVSQEILSSIYKLKK